MKRTSSFLIVGLILLTLLGNVVVVKADEGSLELPRGDWKYYQHEGDSIVTIDAGRTIEVSWEADGYINYKVVNLDTGNNIDSSDAFSGYLICTAEETTRVKIGWQNTFNLESVTVDYDVRITNESAKLCTGQVFNFNMPLVIFLIVVLVILVLLLIHFIIKGSNKKK